MNDQAISVKLSARLPQRQFVHAVRVGRRAELLAGRYGADPRQAKLAGLLHNCAAGPDEGEIVSPDFSPAAARQAARSARQARLGYGISDPAVLRAIELQGLGGPRLAALDKIVYLANFIESNPSLLTAEELLTAGGSLDAAFLEALKRGIRAAGEQGEPIQPAMIETRNCLLMQQAAPQETAAENPKLF